MDRSRINIMDVGSPKFMQTRLLDEMPRNINFLFEHRIVIHIFVRKFAALSNTYDNSIRF